MFSSSSILFSAILLFATTSLTSAIVCYHCDSINKSPGDCPGWHRRPIDTFHDLKDRGGLFSHCVEIKLANGTVLHQGAYPGYPTCGREFLRTWRQSLEKRYRYRILVRCCEGNLCNESTRPKSFGLLPIVIIALFSVFSLKSPCR